MKEVIVSIHQPEYLPYLGHFFKISKANHHIFLDDVQAERNVGKANGWQYRNRFAGGAYHNAPKEKIHLGDKINEVGIRNLGMSLADWNIALTVTLAQELRLKTQFHRSSLIQVEYENPTDRLVKLVQSVGGTAYLSGVDGHKYMDLSLFEKAGIKLLFSEYKSPIEEEYFSAMYWIENSGIEQTIKLMNKNGRVYEPEA